jgi:GNAT superfamily N-acetyltransferase
MTPVPRALQRHERESVAIHFLALSPKDRVLRFGAAVSEYAVRDYVEGIDFDRDVVFGVLDARGELIGAGHLARSEGFAELGLSVLSGHRRLGIGSALVSASCLRCHEWGVSELFMQCAATNVAMRNLAHKHGMRVLLDGSEVDAFLPVPYQHLTGQKRPFAPALG